MRALLTLILSTGFVSPALAQQYQKGDQVAVIRKEATVVYRTRNGTAPAGMVFTVRDTRVVEGKQRLQISYLSPGWIDQENVISFDQALETLNQMVDQHSKDDEWRHARATLHSHQGSLDAAIADYTSIIFMKPDQADYYLGRARVLESQQKHDKAITDYTQVIEIAQDKTSSYLALIRRGISWEKSGNLDKAIDDCTRAIQRVPIAPENYHLRALARQKKGDYEKSILDFYKALKFAPQNSTYGANLAWLRSTCPNARLRDGDEAIKYAKQACKLTDSQDITCLKALAAAHAENGAFKQALGALEKASKLDIGLHKEELEKLRTLYKQSMPYHEERKGQGEPMPDNDQPQASKAPSAGAIPGTLVTDVEQVALGEAEYLFACLR